MRFKKILTLLACCYATVASADIWCTGYYPGWEQGNLPASAVDFGALTHIIHFSVLPNSNGTLNSSVNGVTLSNSVSIVSATHAAGRKVLISVGGAGSDQFQNATSAANRSNFVSNLVGFMTSRGYDGIDLDWEPLNPSDANQFTNLVNDLRSAMNTITPRPLLTAAVAVPPTTAAMLAAVQANLDQINLMTYDLSGPYPGWVTWFNAPIYDGNYHFPSTGGLVPSADGMVNALLAAGIPAGKVGIGIAFYGWIWTGGTGTSTGGAALPRQSWTSAPSTTQQSYNTIMSSYYQPSFYRWDAASGSSYLTIDNSGSATDMFVSYDDERTCQSKVSFARNRHLGGVMIWELAQDHMAGQQDPLLGAIKQALATPGQAVISTSNQNVDLSFATAPLGSYRVLWTSNVMDNAWKTLLTTNQSGTGGVIHVIDPGGKTNESRFYRIQTPQ